MRNAGVLLHITSLPSPYGVGTFGKEAEAFVDWLKSAGQTLWQILPISPHGYGGSPYQSPSAFAGNTLFIDPLQLVKLGFLPKAELTLYVGNAESLDIDKATVENNRLLRIAYDGFKAECGNPERNADFALLYSRYDNFKKESASWLDDYALFMSLKKSYDGKPWYEWDAQHKTRSDSAMKTAFAELHDEIRFHRFAQFMFAEQWAKLRRYANANGVNIVGDIPIYVAFDSADVWASPELFLLNDRHEPTDVAGVPPDFFSEDGQLWGNPLYNWEQMANENYLWWVNRVKHAAKFFDLLRIDHFRAFDTYYAVPYGETTARHGEWRNGPGMALFDVIKENLKDLPIKIIAEDLGDICDSVRKLLRDTGYPGMKILPFGFNPQGEDSEHLPHNFQQNIVAYTGTHDNQTFKGWYKSADRKTRFYAKRYLEPKFFEGTSFAAIKCLYKSAANRVVIPIQDILNLPDTARMNTPGTVGGSNWKWRMKSDALTPKAAQKLKKLCETYHR
ncbi:MAG: 4-alpha-glucanotransferase [Oscillospiraceae bacterium]|jgi:4-alpha-glucanotransferase|nr:4-alpha-glucanotransferase [Oscillospiraceae bacterium]